jgi:hypothetical protein
MESLEKEFTDTLAIRGLSSRTQVVYVPMLRDFARFVGKPLDTVVPEDLRAYQRHLAVERQVGFSHFNQPACALRLFFRECLGRTDCPSSGSRSRKNAGSSRRSSPKRRSLGSSTLARTSRALAIAGPPPSKAASVQRQSFRNR